MTLHARIEGFISLSSAQIDIDKVALVVGHNAAGKSALVDGMACALTGQHAARDVTAKKDLTALLHDGFRHASAQVWDDGGNSARMTWPAAEHMTTGKGIYLDLISAGRARLTDAKPAQRADLLWQITKSKITDDDLREALAAGQIPAAAIEQVIERVHRHTIDATLTYYKEKRVKQKGAWEAATGESYGAAKAIGWAPAGWEPSLDKETEAGLQAALVTARKKLEQAVGEGAVSQERRAILEAAAAKLGQAEASFNLAESDLTAYRKQLDDAAAERAKLPALAPHGQVRCPKCKAAIKVEASPGHTKIVLVDEGEKLDEAELKKVRLAIAGLDGQISRLRGNVSNAETLRNTAKSALDTARRAQETLDGMTEGEETKAGDLTAAREAVGAAEGRLRIWAAKAAADVAQRQISGLEVLVHVLGPEGVKLTKTRAVIGQVNADLSIICAAAGGFPLVSIDDDLTIRAGDRPFGLLSAGYQFFASAVMQLALARLQGAPLVLIDGAEVLAGDNRAALLKMVVRSGVPAVIAMAVKKPEDVPDLAKMKLGTTYWIEDGTCRPISE